jgi:hypothetical protein
VSGCRFSQIDDPTTDLRIFTAMNALTSSSPSEVPKKSVIDLELVSASGLPESDPKGLPHSGRSMGRAFLRGASDAMPHPTHRTSRTLRSSLSTRSKKLRIVRRGEVAGLPELASPPAPERAQKARAAGFKPTAPRGSYRRSIFKRKAADSLGIWISSQEGPAHHSWVNLTIHLPVAAAAAPARISGGRGAVYLPTAGPGRGKQRPEPGGRYAQ